MSLFRKKTVDSIIADLNKQKSGENNLGRYLTLKDLIFFGIAAIVGAGVFSTIGQASADGGPAVIFLFIFTGLACGFTAFAYAEFASMVPVSGSAYTYSYVAFGEVIAWIIGWALIMEYAIGNITLAISWSDYFTGLLETGGMRLPQWIQMDYLSAYNGYHEAESLMLSGKSFENLPVNLQNAHEAWVKSPQILGFHFVADIPALGIIVFITWLVYKGMKESRNASNAMVIIKMAVILLVIAIGAFYVDTTNWSPFSPNGIEGVLKGVSAVFFAYIGFDAISTTAEECKNPKKDLPKAMMWSIIICTILYIAIALVLTGMVNYSQLGVGDPLAYVFKELNLTWLSGIIAVSAVVAMASVLLVFQMGQPRIWMSMSRDGLLPKSFAKIHPKYKTPSFATIVTGFVVAIPALFLNLETVTDLCSIGTLFAFSVVCAGVLIMQDKEVSRGSFRTPYINAKYIYPFILIVGSIVAFTINQEKTMEFVTNKPQISKPTTLVTSLDYKEAEWVANYLYEHKLHTENLTVDSEEVLSNIYDNSPLQYAQLVNDLPISPTKKYTSGFALFQHKIPMWLFVVGLIGLTIWAYRKKLSLIPLLGLTCCLYMMAELTIWSWIYFSIWLIVGLIIYFTFSIKHSKLNSNKKTERL